MSAFIRNVGKSFKAESVSLATRFGRRTVGGKHFRNIGPLRGVSAATGFTCDSADFDGTSDILLRGGGMTGAVDGSQGILSLWFRLDGGDGTTRIILTNLGAVNQTVYLGLNTSNELRFRLTNDGADNFTAVSVTTFSVGSTWNHIIISWDTNFSAGNKLVKMVINGVTESPVITDASAAFSVDYTVTDWAIGGNTTPVISWDGCLAELYFNSATYLDVTQASNLALWRTVGGKPENLGLTGNTPTGTAPLGYFHLNDGESAANFATNRGTGGNMSITGTLDTGSTSPSD